jgi:hypothetical protein
MEDSPRGYAVWERRLLARFPCNSGGFSAGSTLSSEDPELPRKDSNLSPEPSPKGGVLVVDDDNRRAFARDHPFGWWRIRNSGLALRAERANRGVCQRAGIRPEPIRIRRWSALSATDDEIDPRAVLQPRAGPRSLRDHAPAFDVGRVSETNMTDSATS